MAMSTEYDLESGQAGSERDSSNNKWSWESFRKTFRRGHSNRVKSSQPETIIRTLADSQEGYPRLATFLSRDRSFMQYRGFSSLHARVLLSQQYDLGELERKLDDLDRWEWEEGDKKKLQCKQRDDARVPKEKNCPEFPWPRTRQEILDEVKRQLLSYDELLLKAREVANMNRPSRRDWRSVKTWITNNVPLTTEEQDFVLRKEDLVTLRTGRQGGDFEDLVEQMIEHLDDFFTSRLKSKFIKDIFVSPDLRKKTSDGFMICYVPERIDRLTFTIITAVIFALLILPVVAMYELSSGDQRSSPLSAFGILILFTLLFCVAMHSLTRATRQELFAASAAYCAVLVVFISNFNTQTVQIVD